MGWMGVADSAPRSLRARGGVVAGGGLQMDEGARLSGLIVAVYDV